MNELRKLIRLAVLIGAIVASMNSSSVAADIAAADFRNSQFRGFTIGGIDAGNMSTEDLNALARSGANLVRIFILLKRCDSCTEYDSFSPQYLSRMDAVIDRLGARSISVVLVLSPMADARGPLWESPTLKASYIQRWKSLSERYRGVSNIAGFDLMNEPVPGGPTFAHRQTTWLAYAETLGKEIRAIDPKRVLVVESAPDATPASFSNMRPLSLSNVVYSVHSYHPIALTHQGVMKEYSKPLTYGGGGESVGRIDLARALEPVAEFSAKYNVPILVGEFSCVRWAPEGSALRYVGDSIEIFESKGWSWVYHEFRAWPGWDPEIESESPAARRRSFDAPLMNVLRRKMTSNLK